MTLHTDLVLMAEIFKIAYGMSWKPRRTSWMMQGEEVKLHLPNTSEKINMP